MPSRTNSWNRRLRSAGGKILRRYRLLPGGMPDGLGDDESLRDAVLEGEVLVYFPDTADSLYQLRGWYGPLRALHEQQGVTVVCMDSRVAATIRSELELPVVTIARDATLDAIILRSDIKLVLYVNYNPMNTAALRSRSVIHVSMLHGDSDKSVSVSNQIKAFDYSFVAGPAAIDRLRQYTALFDARSRCIEVGRPSLDTEASTARTDADPAHPAVLYAPTWEGGQSSVAYSSLLSHAETAVRSLLADGVRVIYRPHPLTGVRVPEYGEADARLRRLLVGDDGPGRAPGPDGAPLGRVSAGRGLEEDFADADLLLCDVSAVANDWLATGRPLVVTASADVDAHDAETELLRVVPRLTLDDAPRAAEIVRREVEDDPRGEERRALISYYLGDTTRGASLARFLQACRDLAAQRDELWARIRAAEGRSSLEHGAGAP
ncbi:CDP-glycerol glycerophosphotransferase family protein [Brachybacterium sp. DNPG3]